MNISRGLLRLWMLLAVLWVGGTGALVFSEWRAAVEVDKAMLAAAAAPKESQIDLFAALGIDTTVDSPKTPAPPDWFLAAPSVTDHPSLQQAQPFDVSAMLGQAAQGKLRYTSPDASAGVTAFWASAPVKAEALFLPPLALLLAGMALRWVARGFRP
jgi:hypothetical protein